MKLIAACAFGLEAIVKRELIALGYEPQVQQPGRIAFEGSTDAICQANLWLRCADRVLIEIQQFDCPDFEALFETVKAFDWSRYIPADASFPVIGKSRLSKLTSVPAVQRATKKALVESLQKYHGVTTLPETGGTYKVEVALLNDVATLTVDTTGASLHKRGYRKLVGPAPLKETLAAALVDLSVWKPGRILVDPFCGSGTIPIEAAMIGRNLAPGLEREFAASHWSMISQKQWHDAREHARSLAKPDLELQLTGSDRDQEVLSLARYHAKVAGVADTIQFHHREFADLRSQQEYGCLVTNPPYGERLEDHQRLVGLYESIPMVMQRLPTWSLFLITNLPQFESLIQRQATRRRKLFNGRIECTYYQFLGPRPPKDFFADPPSLESGRSVASDAVVATERQLVDDWQRPTQDQNEVPQPPARVVPVTVSHDGTPASDLIRKSNHSTQSQPEQLQRTQPDTPEISKPRVEIIEMEPKSNIESSSTAQDPAEPLPPTSGRKGRQSISSAEQPRALFGELTAKDHEQANLFRNRLIKRARHLRKWPSRGITCCRLYERDIPEIPLVVDRYEDHLHLTEYERPHERDLARHAAWLDLMVQAAADCLDIPIDQAHLKQRRKGDEGQYKKLDEQRQRMVVGEQGLKFLVNLVDYVDTGLFLDHRNTRQMVRQKASGLDVLNLFSYTGSFTVYAADGGARSTTTVDLSKTYVDWAKANLELNQLQGAQHQFVVRDTIEYLDSIADKGPQFDLAVVDPPTYSNSKRLEDDWDVQMGYVEVLQRLANCLRPAGEVYFSTNYRRFKFDESAIGPYDVREISNQTVPDDFRNKRIHRCWWLKRKP